MIENTPRHLDPTASYWSNDTLVTYQVYEPLYGYHYLKRPIELVPKSAAEVVKPSYYDKAGNRLADDAPGELVAESVYDVPIRKGILFQVERTIPLENIQDVTFIEGPLLKQFHLATVKFETAGQSAGQAHDMQLTGIIDAHEFRAEIMARREALKQAHLVPSSSRDDQTAVLLAIKKSLDELLALAKARQDRTD